jgi:hypothetical protein
VDGVREVVKQGWAVGYRCGPVALDVSGNDRADLAWLAEFMEPWCDAAAPGDAPLQVRMLRSDSMAATLRRDWAERRRAGRLASALPALRLDRQTVAFDSWMDDEALRLVDPETGCGFVIDGRRVDVVAAPGERGPDFGLLRVLREIIVGGIGACWPTVDLHAAAFVHRGEAVAIAGPKKAGKTSLLCHALISAGAALLANDRLVIEAGALPPLAHGIPTVVAIRRGTVERFPPLLSRAADFPALLRIDPAVQRHFGDAVPPPPGDGSELLLSPMRLAGRLGAPVAPPTRLRSILLLELSGDLAGWGLELLPPGAARSGLEACLYGAAADREAPTFFASLAGAAPRPAPIEERLARLAAALPVYRCRLGRDAYDRPATALIQALEHGRS